MKLAKVKIVSVYLFLFFLTLFSCTVNGQVLLTSQFSERDSNIPDSELALMTEVSKKIKFYKNTYLLTLESIEAIEKIATLLEQNPYYNLVISGHYFESFSKRRNLKLSLLQAEAIKTHFIFIKLDESRIKVNGFGDRIPISLANLSLNTRIDLSINY